MNNLPPALQERIEKEFEKMFDLYIQATTENTHYYTAAVIKEAALEIMKLRDKITFNTK